MGGNGGRGVTKSKNVERKSCETEEEREGEKKMESRKEECCQRR